MTNKNILLISGMIILAALTRFIPHPFNFTAIGAMALFSGANVKDRRIAFLLPMMVMLITDLYFGFHPSIIPVYLAFAFSVMMGITIRKKQNVLNIGGAAIICSVVFFLITNLPVWYQSISLYPLTWSGTMESYSMALPFFGNQVAGDLIYSGILFGAYSLVKQKYPALAR
jgi:hypothetical protein